MITSAIVLARQKNTIHKSNACIGILVLIEWVGEDYHKHHFSLADPWGSEKPSNYWKTLFEEKVKKGRHNKHMEYASTFEI